MRENGLLPRGKGLTSLRRTPARVVSASALLSAPGWAPTQGSPVFWPFPPAPLGLQGHPCPPPAFQNTVVLTSLQVDVKGELGAKV